MKTKEEIEDKIKELVSDKDNFVMDNYGSEACDNGEYEERFSEWMTTKTLNKFVEWINCLLV